VPLRRSNIIIEKNLILLIEACGDFPTMEVIIKLSDRKDKRYMAVFYDNEKKIKTTHFGYAITDDRGSRPPTTKNEEVKGIKKYGSTYIDHKNDTLKDNYIARHQVNENFEDFMSAGSLSRYILWNKKTFRESLADYKRRFKLIFD